MRTLIATALSAALALTACSRERAPAAPADTAKVDTAPVPPVIETPVIPPVAVSAPPCRSGDLSLARAAADAGAGQRQVTYAFTNNGPAACSLKGYPTLTLFDPDGKRVDQVQTVQTETAIFNIGGPPGEVTLQPKGKAAFFITFTGIQASDKPCVTASRLQATPPGNTQALELTDVIQPCTGQVRITPVRPPPSDAGPQGSSTVFY